MSDENLKPLQEALWRRPLTPSEQRRLRSILAARSETETAWEEEIRLNRLLDRLPDTPVPTNFTSLVLRAAEKEAASFRKPARRRAGASWRAGFHWVLRFATICLVVMLAGVALQHHRHTLRRVELARNLGQVSTAAALPADWLQNFDAIKRLNQPVPADEELLAVLR